jgi:hypothetical protein
MVAEGVARVQTRVSGSGAREVRGGKDGGIGETGEE